MKELLYLLYFLLCVTINTLDRWQEAVRRHLFRRNR